MSHTVGILRNSQKLKKSVLHLYCTSIVRNTLQQFFYSHPDVAFSRLKVSVRISVQQALVFITIS